MGRVKEWGMEEEERLYQLYLSQGMLPSEAVGLADEKVWGTSLDGPAEPDFED